MGPANTAAFRLRIFHYSPWYTYLLGRLNRQQVENLSLFALIYLIGARDQPGIRWESFIIRLDILNRWWRRLPRWLRIFHYSPWYTYEPADSAPNHVENLSLFALIYLFDGNDMPEPRWESFIIRLDILSLNPRRNPHRLRIFHYSPWYT